ncbi:MAG: hypothetical protein AB7J86_08230, partial [Vulcanimicrobiota bacterium]
MSAPGRKLRALNQFQLGWMQLLSETLPERAQQDEGSYLSQAQRLRSMSRTTSHHKIDGSELERQKNDRAEERRQLERRGEERREPERDQSAHDRRQTERRSERRGPQPEPHHPLPTGLPTVKRAVVSEPNPPEAPVQPEQAPGEEQPQATKTRSESPEPRRPEARPRQSDPRASEREQQPEQRPGRAQQGPQAPEHKPATLFGQLAERAASFSTGFSQTLKESTRSEQSTSAPAEAEEEGGLLERGPGRGPKSSGPPTKARPQSLQGRSGDVGRQPGRAPGDRAHFEQPKERPVTPEHRPASLPGPLVERAAVASGSAQTLKDSARTETSRGPATDDAPEGGLLAMFALAAPKPVTPREEAPGAKSTGFWETLREWASDAATAASTGAPTTTPKPDKSSWSAAMLPSPAVDSRPAESSGGWWSGLGQTISQWVSEAGQAASASAPSTTPKPEKSGWDLSSLATIAGATLVGGPVLGAATAVARGVSEAKPSEPAPGGFWSGVSDIFGRGETAKVASSVKSEPTVSGGWFGGIFDSVSQWVSEAGKAAAAGAPSTTPKPEKSGWDLGSLAAIASTTLVGGPVLGATTAVAKGVSQASQPAETTGGWWSGLGQTISQWVSEAGKAASAGAPSTTPKPEKSGWNLSSIATVAGATLVGGPVLGAATAVAQGVSEAKPAEPASGGFWSGVSDIFGRGETATVASSVKSAPTASGGWFGGIFDSVSQWVSEAGKAAAAGAPSTTPKPEKSGWDLSSIATIAGATLVGGPVLGAATAVARGVSETKPAEPAPGGFWSGVSDIFGRGETAKVASSVKSEPTASGGWFGGIFDSVSQWVSEAGKAAAAGAPSTTPKPEKSGWDLGSIAAIAGATVVGGPVLGAATAVARGVSETKPAEPAPGGFWSGVSQLAGRGETGKELPSVQSEPTASGGWFGGLFDSVSQWVSEAGKAAAAGAPSTTPKPEKSGWDLGS